MSTESGKRAEELAARYLRHQGLKILAYNWRNRFCEIDLVARDGDGTIHIIEVKYRKSAEFGSGFDYVTPDKLRRLRQAALAWQAENRHEGSIQVGAVSVDGDTIDYLPNVLN